MHQVLRFAGLLGVVLVSVPLLAQEATKPEGPDQKLIDKALSNPYLQGKLVAVDLEKKTFTIQAVIDSTKTINKEGQKAYAAIYARALQAYRARNKNELDKLMPQLQAAAIGVYDIKEVTHNFKLWGNGDFQVRIEKLPAREGDDGKVKPYTPKELSDLKGNPNLPGYKADPKKLDVEIQVRAYLVPKAGKTAPKKVEPPKLVIKTAGSADKPKEMMAEDAHPISSIMILPVADPAAMPALPGAPAVPAGANPFVIK